MPWTAHAAGLGKLTVNSNLGQPLSAEIDLLGVQKKELDTLEAKLASPDSFKQANIQYVSALSGIKFSIEKKPDGQSYLKLKTLQPVNEAFLDFLIELNWSSGRLVKEYTVLLDPPGFTPIATTAPVAVPTTPLPAPAEEAKPELAGIPPDEKIGAEAALGAAAPLAEAPEAAALEAQAPAAPAPEEQKTYGPIKYGETLSKIAGSVKPSGYTLEQMLIGLFRSNKSAFMGNNMNRMKTGPILNVPESSELATIEPDQAVKEVRVQARDWNAYRQRLAEAAGLAAPTEIAKQTATGKITTKVEDQATPQEPGKEVLKLSKGELPTGKPGGTSNKALQDRVRSLEEEVVAREKAIKEANERITLLEKNIRDMQRLLEIKSQNLAELQKQAGAAKAPQPAAQPAPAPKPAEIKAPESKPAEPKKPEEKPAVVAAAKPTEAPKPAGKTTAPPPPPETSFLDDILDNPLYLGGGAGVVILLLGLGYIVVRKKKSITSFEESVVNEEGLKASTVFGNTEGGVVVNTGDSVLMSDIASKSVGPVTTDDVDPVAEADVYIAYGRDTQAEEILKEALKKNPTHHNIRLKLLEIYAARKNVPVFDTLARELYAATGSKPGPIWDRAAQLGYALNPDNPLYESAKSAAAEPPLKSEAPSPPQMDFNIALPVTSGDQLSTDIGMDSNAPAAEKAFTSFDFEIPSVEPAKLTPDLPLDSEKPAAADLDFDVGPLPTGGGPAEEAAASHEAPLEMISFNFEPSIPAATPASAAAPPQAEVIPIDLSGISLTLDESTAGPAAEEPAKDQHWYEVQTKFDLAKAYQEMGDKEGAREILQEVMREGDAKQQEQAKGLLAKL